MPVAVIRTRLPIWTPMRSSGVTGFGWITTVMFSWNVKGAGGHRGRGLLASVPRVPHHREGAGRGHVVEMGDEAGDLPIQRHQGVGLVPREQVGEVVQVGVVVPAVAGVRADQEGRQALGPHQFPRRGPPPRVLLRRKPGIGKICHLTPRVVCPDWRERRRRRNRTTGRPALSTGSLA